MQVPYMFRAALAAGSLMFPCVALAEDAVPITDVTIVAPQNVYSQECVDALQETGVDNGCTWASACEGGKNTVAIPFVVEQGYYMAQIKEGSWGTHGSACGANTPPEHTLVQIVVPSAKTTHSVGAPDLTRGEPVYFATIEDGPIYFVLVDIDNVNNGGTIVVSLYSSKADADFDGHQDVNFGGDDCNDRDAQIFPTAPELCDGKDNNCDLSVDENTDYDGLGGSDCVDDDGDGFTEEEGDCDDTNKSIQPCSAELYDSIDNNCDGEVDNPGNASGCSCGDADESDICKGALMLFGGAWWMRRRRKTRPAE